MFSEEANLDKISQITYDFVELATDKKLNICGRYGLNTKYKYIKLHEKDNSSFKHAISL